MRVHRLRLRTCEMCSTEYQPTYSKQRTCSRACGVDLRAEAGTLPTKTIAAKAANQITNRYRSHHALRRAVNAAPTKQERARIYYLKTYQQHKENYYKAAYKRRALIKGAEHEHIRRHDVFESDNWTCRHCGSTVTDSVSRGHPRKAIMAHIVALASGGHHTRDNVCTLCHACNTRDGVNQLPLQTVLFNQAVTS